MGCASSSHVVTDPHTGQATTKHKMGGSYPGNRRTPLQAYTPNASEFNAQGQATAHFISYGGGNALVLQQGGVPKPQVGQPGAGHAAKKPEYVQVTLPAGVHAGQRIHVAAPDGRLNEIIVPDGFGPGSTFTVEFAESKPNGIPPPIPAPTTTTAQSSSSYTPMSTATPAAYNPSYTNNNNDGDDGFATGFNNPNFRPTATATMANAYGDNDLSSYPSATDAKPVYSTTPQYTASAY